MPRLSPKVKRITRLLFEFLIIPLIMSIAVGPYMVEIACKYRQDSSFRFRIMELHNGKDIPLPNIDIIIEEIGSYRTDSLGYSTIQIKNNKSIVPLISCNTCKNNISVVCVAFVNGKDKKGICTINLNESTEQTQIIYVE